MANLGELTEVINSLECTLEVGANNYITLTNLHLHIGRIETRSATTGGLIYIYGRGDNWFTGTLEATTPELDSLNTITQLDTNGAMTSTAWKIVYLNVSGATKTFAAIGVLRDIDLDKGAEDVVHIDIFVRITGDTITVS